MDCWLRCTGRVNLPWLASCALAKLAVRRAAEHAMSGALDSLKCRIEFMMNLFLRRTESFLACSCAEMAFKNVIGFKNFRGVRIRLVNGTEEAVAYFKHLF